ncbi:MAG: hypothetical protein LDL11_05070 [Desulfarculus sp.]|nr:hypothetical protein [Desulfarculus sp.]
MSLMERITLNSLQNIANDYLGVGHQRKRNPGAAESEAANQAPARPTAENPVQADNPSRVSASALAADLAQTWPRMNQEEAAQALDQTLPQVAASSPWKLAEVHDLTERSLVPQPYV